MAARFLVGPTMRRARASFSSLPEAVGYALELWTNDPTVKVVVADAGDVQPETRETMWLDDAVALVVFRGTESL